MSGKSLGRIMFDAYWAGADDLKPKWDRLGEEEESFERAAAAVVAAHEASRWRKVEDGLPPIDPKESCLEWEFSVPVLAFNGLAIRICRTDQYDRDEPLVWRIEGCDGYRLDNVTHWAALPAPPEGGTR